ncbi:hypothetical protein AMTRI_Chr04g182420 [Amborella trichopoda]
MASLSTFHLFFLTLSLFHFASAARITPAELVQDQPLTLKYHNGHVLSGRIAVNLIWYGSFTPSQRAIISDLFLSLSSPKPTSPSVSSWWQTTQKYRPASSSRSLRLTLNKQILDTSYSLGKTLTNAQLVALASKGDEKNAINVVLTAKDVAVEGFCSSRCGTHGSARSAHGTKFTYIWVGNSETQCPGQCAWPFHKPIYGPQTPALVAPNGDVGVDGMAINVGSLMAGTVTNPFGDGYYQGPANGPLEAASACPGIYGKGAYPGYAGDLLVDEVSGASYNANGVNGRKYLLPALWDPETSSCSTLV